MRARRNGILRQWHHGSAQGPGCIWRYGAVKRVGGTIVSQLPCSNRDLSAGGGGIGSWRGSRPPSGAGAAAIDYPLETRALNNGKPERAAKSARAGPARSACAAAPGGALSVCGSPNGAPQCATTLEFELAGDGEGQRGLFLYLRAVRGPGAGRDSSGVLFPALPAMPAKPATRPP